MKDQELNFTNFTRVEVNHTIEVEITQSSTHSVSLIVENFDIKDVNISQTEDKLSIGRRWLSIKSWFAGPAAKIKAKITMPELVELALSAASRGRVAEFGYEKSMLLKLSGASSLDLADISAGAVTFDVSGASRMTGNITVESAEFKVRGASTVQLSGSAGQVTMDASGASRFVLDGLRAGDANLRLQGASYGTVRLTGKLDARLSGASRLLYSGTPALGRISTSGASTVNEMEEAAASPPKG